MGTVEGRRDLIADRSARGNILGTLDDHHEGIRIAAGVARGRIAVDPDAVGIPSLPSRSVG